MKYFLFYDEKSMKIFDFSNAKFIFIVYALMCTWSSLTHNTLLSVSTAIDHYFDIDLSSIYSYAEVWGGIDYFSLVVLAPVIETIIFQVIIQNISRKITSSLFLSVLIASFLFSLTHLTNNIANAVNALGLGVAFAVTYEYFRVKYGHCWATLVTILLHAFWNASLSYSFYPEKLMGSGM